MKPGAVPNVFAWSSEATAASLQRIERASKRMKRFDTTPADIDDVGNEVTIEADNGEPIQPPEQEEPVIPVAVSRPTQTPHDPPMSIDRFTHNDEAVHHLTGLESYDKFVFVLSTLGPAAYNLNYRWKNCQLISVPNQFFITLIKLRQHRSNYDLGLMFDISEYSVGNIFVTWVNFLYHQWNELNIWPSRDLVSYFMPVDFKRKFPSTRIILDGTECPIQKPKCPLAQQVTFSTYKNKNTAKVVVGASPGGLVTYIPEAYGGSTSDRQFIERSELTNTCDQGDSLMADKGINVQDIFAPVDVTVNIPTFLKKGNQFKSKTLARDRKVASKRVHIERIIGLAKTYKILTQPLNSIESTLASELIYICFMLCNFRTCIVPHDA